MTLAGREYKDDTELTHSFGASFCKYVSGGACKDPHDSESAGSASEIDQSSDEEPLPTPPTQHSIHSAADAESATSSEHPNHTPPSEIPLGSSNANLLNDEIRVKVCADLDEYPDKPPKDAVDKAGLAALKEIVDNTVQTKFAYMMEISREWHRGYNPAKVDTENIAIVFVLKAADETEVGSVLVWLLGDMLEFRLCLTPSAPADKPAAPLPDGGVLQGEALMVRWHVDYNTIL